MPPRPSKLYWSNTKPIFEEVLDKTVIIEWRAGRHFTDIVRISTRADFNNWFDHNFLQYAILDMAQPDPLPLALWGAMPHIVETHEGMWYAYYEKGLDDDTFSIQTLNYATRAETILAWNKISTRLTDIPPKEEQRNE